MRNPIAVSTWSLHRLLGYSFANGPGQKRGPAQPTWGEGSCRLEDLPAALAQHGYFRAEICHFHLASRDVAYLHGLRRAFEASGVVIQTLLIDDGDLTDPATRARDAAWIADWIDAAAELGAENARVVAGKRGPEPEAVALAVEGLADLCLYGKSRGVRIVTENWFDLLSAPKAVHQVLKAVGGDLGFLADTGNWSGDGKYADLASIFGRAELCHAKASFGPGFVMDSEDFGRCVDAAVGAGYSGPFTLIYDGPDADEWAGLALERDFISARAG